MAASDEPSDLIPGRCMISGASVPVLTHHDQTLPSNTIKPEHPKHETSRSIQMDPKAASPRKFNPSGRKRELNIVKVPDLTNIHARASRATLDPKRNVKTTASSKLTSENTISYIFWNMASPPCFTSSSEMIQLTISSLRNLNDPTIKSYIYLKPCGPFMRNVTTALLQAEDVTGEVCTIEFRNLSARETDVNILPENYCIYIKQPIYTTIDAALELKGFLLCHPADYRMTSLTEPNVPTSWARDDFRPRTFDAAVQKGKALNEKRRYVESRLFYYHAHQILLKTEVEGSQSFKKKKAVLDHGFFCVNKGLRFNDQEYIKESDAEFWNPKLLALTNGFIGEMRDQPEVSVGFYKELLAIHDVPLARLLYRETLERLEQRDEGRYDFPAAFRLAQEHAASGKELRLDVCSFIKRTTIKDSPIHGKGLFAVEAIPRGSLIIVERPYNTAMHVKDSGLSRYTHEVQKFDAYGEYSKLLGELVQKSDRNPMTGMIFMKLYSGDADPIKDLRIVDERLVVNMHDIAAIMRYNSFRFPAFGSDPSISESGMNYDQCMSVGLWLVAARINHSCLPNAQRSFMADMMIVRATRDIEKGEEILFSYVDQTWRDYSKVRDQLDKTWGFKCNCALCFIEAFELKKGRHRPRGKLWREFVTMANDETSKERDGLPSLKTLNLMRRKFAPANSDSLYNSPRWATLPHQMTARIKHWLAATFYKREDNKTAWNMGISALGDLRINLKAIPDPQTEINNFSLSMDTDGVMINENCIHLLLLLAAVSRDQEVCPQGFTEQGLVQKARELYTICYGQDVGFETSFKRELHVPKV